MEKLFLIDAYALIFRFHYAFISRPMRSASGMNTSAIFGFCKFLSELIARERPHYLGVAFDPPGGNFRHTLYPAYKANRDATPEDIKAAVPCIKEALEAMHIPILEVPGYEADDVIGTLSYKASGCGQYQIYMVTPDKDYGQLIRQDVSMYKPGKGGDGIEIIGLGEVCQAYGISDPRLVIDILALWGDASDNIPGVPGIGEKGAKKLVSQWGDIETIMAHAHELSPKLRDAILGNQEQLRLAKQLATIDLSVPIEFDPKQLEVEEPDYAALRAIYIGHNFSQLLRDIDSQLYHNNALLARELPSLAAERRGQDRGGDQRMDQREDRGQGGRKAVPYSQSGGAQAGGNQAGGGQMSLFDQAGAAGPASERALPMPDLADLPVAEAPAGAPAEAKYKAPAEAKASAEGKASEDQGFQTIDTTPHAYFVVDTEERLQALVQRLEAVDAFSFDTETGGIDPLQSELVGLSFAVQAHQAWWVPTPTGPERDRVLRALRPLLENPAIGKVGQNLKFDMLVLRHAAGIELQGPLYDTMIIHYLLDPEARHNMDFLARHFLDYAPIPIERLIGRGAKQISMTQVADRRLLADYAAEDADVTWQLYEKLWPLLQGVNQVELYERIEAPLIPVLARIEYAGIYVDSDILKGSGAWLAGAAAQLEEQIRRIIGMPHLNVNSAKQLGDALFEGLRIDPKPKKTKTGQYRTDEEYLQSLSENHPVIEKILEYRGIKKLLSTYVEALPQLINPASGRIHTSFNQAVTATGRLSSTNPNMQNIPIRDAAGREIRKAFTAPDYDHVILSADYSQVELRVMAHLSGDAALQQAFFDGEDIHTATAAKIYGIALNEVTREQRRRAKTANFGIIYGISAFGLASRLKISRSEAKELIDGYFRHYPGVQRYMERTVELARELGYVETICGRRRYLPDIRSANALTRSYAERNAINAPIQGSAADIMKIAMIRVDERLQLLGSRARMVLQVHDELVLEVPQEEVTKITTLVTELMASATKLAVPLLVDAEIGTSWLDAH